MASTMPADARCAGAVLPLREEQTSAPAAALRRDAGTHVATPRPAASSARSAACAARCAAAPAMRASGTALLAASSTALRPQQRSHSASCAAPSATSAARSGASSGGIGGDGGGGGGTGGATAAAGTCGATSAAAATTGTHSYGTPLYSPRSTREPASSAAAARGGGAHLRGQDPRRRYDSAAPLPVRRTAGAPSPRATMPPVRKPVVTKSTHVAHQRPCRRAKSSWPPLRRSTDS